ncbi:RNA polymerase sigma factor, sigma-70 family [Gemmatirosa kalamazoonensis]|uniref:RNA polymerase sigma factor, sigma-70 family n=1 Tax=Gemmatirosa kalamazoonensis TaxID=861299 RepID=W0RE30_9BACT|nr:sigma-70 family RNA polymerase sigma factor [Gemmatirosa kalamazoonensis]AHG89066.1 RNA polymerase sigma factor, sigma-70 family [Gemmatirosa kalamazoonensis]
MTERDDYEALFLSHLPFLERALDAVARVLGMRDGDAEEFASWAKERLWEGDYRILRKWRGESRLTTYLTTVVTTLGREFRVKQWGRWRPSAAAQHNGPLAVRLETLVYRDGLRLEEAAELLRTRGETEASDHDLAVLLARLPARARPRRGDERDVSLDGLPASTVADDRVDSAESLAERRTAYEAMYEAIRRLEPLEQVVIRMHFLEGRSLADVARALDVPQKPLYRMKDRALATLAHHLTTAGITREQVRDLLGGSLPADAPETDAGRGNSLGSWPSKRSCDSSPETEGSGSSTSSSDRSGGRHP